MEISFKISDKLLPESRTIRTTVFVNEQGFNEEFDKDDDKALHILMYADKKAIGNARVIYSDEHNCYTIGRFAILKPYRGLKLGSRLLLYVEEVIKEKYGPIEVGISSQERAIGFYLKNGYTLTGETYLDENYPHYFMVKKL